MALLLFGRSKTRVNGATTSLAKGLRCRAPKTTRTYNSLIVLSGGWQWDV